MAADSGRQDDNYRKPIDGKRDSTTGAVQKTMARKTAVAQKTEADQEAVAARRAVR